VPAEDLKKGLPLNSDSGSAERLSLNRTFSVIKNRKCNLLHYATVVRVDVATPLEKKWKKRCQKTWCQMAQCQMMVSRDNVSNDRASNDKVPNKNVEQYNVKLL
jgi:hypothetical protein